MIKSKGSNIIQFLIIVIISVVITTLILSGVGYFVYKKYLKKDIVQEMIVKNLYNSFKDQDIGKIIVEGLRKYAGTEDIKIMLEKKLGGYVGSSVTIDTVSFDDEEGLVLAGIEIPKAGCTINIEKAFIIPFKGIELDVVKTTQKNKDMILIKHAFIDFLNNITLNEVMVMDPENEITGPVFNAKKIIVDYNPLNLLKGELFIRGVTALSPEFSLLRTKDGIWTIMDAVKGVIDKIHMPAYANLLENGVVAKDAAVHLIDKDLFIGEVMDVSGIDMIIKPFSGSLSDLSIDGTINDSSFGSYSLTGKWDVDIPRLKIKVVAKDLESSEEFLQRLPVIGQGFWDTYKPIGRFGIDAVLIFDNDKGKRGFDRTVKVAFNDMDTTYYRWPTTVSRCTGELLLTDGKINIKNVQGYLFQDGQQGAGVRLDAILEIDRPAKEINIRASNVAITEEFIKKMPEECEKFWREFHLNGQLDANIVYLAGGEDKDNPDDYAIEINCKGCDITHPEVPIPIKNINGRVVVKNETESGISGKGQRKLRLMNMRGYFNDGVQITPIEFNGEFDMDGPQKTLLINVPGLNITNELLTKMPEGYGRLWNDFKPSGQVDLHITYDYRDQNHKPDLDISMDCKGCNFEDARFPVPLFGVIGMIDVNGNHISARHLIGRSYGGQVEGSVQIDMQDKSYQYDGEFGFSEMDMETLVQNVFKTDQKWHGLLSGKIKFHQGKNGESGFVSTGTVIFKEGKISDVPIALSIINILNLGLPTRVVFERGYIDFLIKDNNIIIEEAKIYSSTLELTARGKVDFNGNLDVNVIVGFNNDTLLSIPLVGKLVDFVVGGVRKRLTKVHVGGNIKEPESSLVMLRQIKQPIKDVLELIPTNGKGSGTSTATPTK